MTKATMKITLSAFTACLLASTAYAQPVSLSDAQMDSVAAGGMDRVDGFVCPAISGNGVTKNDKFFSIGDGYYSFHGPDVSVPMHATNRNGDGRPAAGQFSAPGDTDYTAIWGFRPTP